MTYERSEKISHHAITKKRRGQRRVERFIKENVTVNARNGMTIKVKLTC